MHGPRIHRHAPALGVAFAFVVLAGCLGSPREGQFSRLVITGDEIAEAGYDNAYEALTHHRELIVLENAIGFRGGDDSAFGSDAQGYYIPLLVVDGNWNLNDSSTTLRRIGTPEIISIRLYRASMVPPVYRRPGSEGGVIEVRTR